MKFGHAACPPHLLLRSGIDYFGIVVAERLRPAFCCRTEFRISLFTRSESRAPESLVSAVINRPNLECPEGILARHIKPINAAILGGHPVALLITTTGSSLSLRLVRYRTEKNIACWYFHLNEILLHE
ncbi:MAG: hypothetical protein ACYC1G_12565 [Thiobacillus sp.]